MSSAALDHPATQHSRDSSPEDKDRAGIEGFEMFLVSKSSNTTFIVANDDGDKLDVGMVVSVATAGANAACAVANVSDAPITVASVTRIADTDADNPGAYTVVLNTGSALTKLEQLAFTMTVTNVDAALYNNNKIVFEWDPFIPDRKTIATPNAMRYSQVAGDGDPKQYTMTVPDGTYSLLDLEVLIARELYQKTDAIDHYGAVTYPSPGSSYTNLIKEIRPTSGLFWDMDVMARARPDAAGATVMVANGGNGIPPLTATMGVVTVREQIGTEYVGGYFEISGVKRRIVWINAEGLHDNQVQPADDPTPSTWAPLPKTRIMVDEAWGKTANSPGDGAPVLYPPSSATGVDDAVDFLGYGAAGAAFPTQQPTSGWGTAYSMDELQVIAHTAGSDATSVAPTFVGSEKLEQNQRKIKPVTLSIDPVTHKIQATCASPLVRVTDESTLFSDLLGYSTYTGAIRNPQNMLQLPPASGSARLNLYTTVKVT
eukprot:COSAG02_NODE_1499_length_12268_cov_12.941984_12_plen_486_part_00